MGDLVKQRTFTAVYNYLLRLDKTFGLLSCLLVIHVQLQLFSLQIFIGVMDFFREEFTH